MSFIMGGVLNQQPRSVGVPVWLSRLRIWHCHYSGLGHYIDMGSIPGLGTSTCHGCDPKMKQSKTKTKKEPRRVEWNLFFLPYTCKYHSEIGINHQPMPKKKKNESYMYIAKWKNSVWGGFTLYDSIYMTSWNRWNKDGKQVMGWGVETFQMVLWWWIPATIHQSNPVDFYHSSKS